MEDVKWKTEEVVIGNPKLNIRNGEALLSTCRKQAQTKNPK